MNSQAVRLNVAVCVVMGLMVPDVEIGRAATGTGPSNGRRTIMAQAESRPPGPPATQKNPERVPDAVQGESPGFAIKEFIVEGSELLPPEKIDSILSKYKGSGEQMADLERARAELEQAYQGLGFPTIIVTIPEQTIESGTVRLQVIEGRLIEIRMSGNQYYPRYQIMEKLPSVKPGALLNEKVLMKELDAVNANPDLKVTPVLKPGSEPGSVDLELKVKDRLPLHAKLTGDNKGPFTTPRDRMTAEVSYSNLWNADHILTLQTTQTPTDLGAVQAYGFSYVAPLAGPQNVLAVYASKVISNSALAGASLAGGAGGDIGVAGNATIGGFRYIQPIFEGGTTSHLLTMGLDYKRLEETTATFPGSLGTAVVLSPIQYTPLSLTYTAVRPDPYGVFQFSATAKGYLAIIPGGQKEDFAGDPNDPNNKPGNRAGSTGSFAVLQGSLDRNQPLLWGFSLALHVDGQWASEPLVPAEQYFAGGADTVRGYIANEAIGDEAVRGRAEIQTPNLPDIPIDAIWQRRKSSELKINWKLLAFYDEANLWILNAPAGQANQFRLTGVGGGVRAQVAPWNLNFQLDQGFALHDATATKKGDTFVHFLVSIAY